MASLTDNNKTTDKDEAIVRITGANDELADVDLIEGKNRLYVHSTPGLIAANSRYYEYFVNGTENCMSVDGSVTPVDFSIPTSATQDLYIKQIRIFGGGNGIQFTQFLALSTALTNGLLLSAKTDDYSLSLPPIKTTEDFKNLWSNPVTNFRIDIQSGADQFIAAIDLNFLLVLRKQGTHATDDYLKITVRDDLDDAKISCLHAKAVGVLT